MRIRFHLKWIVVLMGSIFFAVVLMYSMFYAPGSRPTCISFEVAGDKMILDAALSQLVTSKKMIKKSFNDDSLHGHNDEIFLKSDQLFDGSSLIFLCATTKDGNEWQQAVKDLERGLLGKVDIRRVLLQRGADYSCDRNCEFQNCTNPCSQMLQLPINFDRLKSSGTLR
jgi:hypothetical protein